MKSLSFAALVLMAAWWMPAAADPVLSEKEPVTWKPDVKVTNVCLPAVLDREYNVAAVICIDNGDGKAITVDDVSVVVSGLPGGAVRNVSLMYTGTMAPLYSETVSQGIRTMFSYYGASQGIFADADYAMRLGSCRPEKDGTAVLAAGKKLVMGKNWFYVSVSVDRRKIREISDVFRLEVTGVGINGTPAAFVQEGCTEHRLAVGLRNHGDDGVFAYRIPGLVTTPAGTLIAVYDVRYHTSQDLQEDIDIGMSRSTDGGRTWEKMKIIMDMGEWGGLPEAQNGIGDPAVLVDDETGEIFVVAVWTHGLGNGRAWNQVGDGFSPEETAQLMLVSSIDDGRTWSAPRNITGQVKQKDWRFTLQGPGRGITMQDGTLVFPIQYVGQDRVPNAGIMYSKDHGQTWHCHGHAWTNTTESQVAEVGSGVLMLNMRNNRGTGRIVCTTEDMGRTWHVHPSSEKLREPVCMAGLLHVPADKNVLGKDILLFSNPDTEQGRNHLTIKASLDGGITWLPENSLLIDAEEGWGYSCLTMIDSSTVGILYEGSVSQIVFQSVKLEDIVKTE